MTDTSKRYADAFAVKDGFVRRKSRFILGFSAVAYIGGRQFCIVAPTIDALEIAWLDAVKYPLEKSKVQKVAIAAQEKVS
jgi:hypothetical protein